VYWSYLFLFQTNFFFGRVNVVFLATALGVGRTGVRIPVARVLILKHVEAGPGVPTSRHFNAYGGFFPPGVKWPERDGDNLLESSVEVETVCNYTSIPCPTPSCRDVFTFFVIFISESQHAACYI